MKTYIILLYVDKYIFHSKMVYIYCASNINIFQSIICFENSFIFDCVMHSFRCCLVSKILHIDVSGFILYTMPVAYANANTPHDELFCCCKTFAYF